ncbi:YIP1 family protein [Ruegeria arenilitoris]|uniref:YIP1 family protein n=1 Tax=Ruegeria arenilitoris TaxID=1173585 RepID=UPI00147E153E|nr:YIP1 family protein [Ruegeria arenilitoris]
MTGISLRALVMTTVTNPAEAARQLLALKLNRETLWLGLALAIVLNSLVHVVSNMLAPLQDPDLQALAGSLVLYVVLAGGSLLLSIAAVYQVGRLLGGTGSFEDVMILMVWMQFFRVLVQVFSLILMLIMPGLFAVLAFAAALFMLYVVVHFIDQAHRFGSPLKALGVLVLSALAIAVIVIVLLSLVGGPMLGTPAYV